MADLIFIFPNGILSVLCSPQFPPVVTETNADPPNILGSGTIIEPLFP